MKKVLQYGLAFLAMLLLGACATVGDAVKIPLKMPGGESATIVAHKQMWPDWLLAQDSLKINYLVKGDVGDKQLAAIVEAERACRIFTGTVRPSNLVAVLSSGLLYAVAGYVGVGFGARAFMPGVNTKAYSQYGAGAGGFAGAANGIITLGGQTYTFENCGREVFDLFPGYQIRVLQKSPY